MVGLLTLLASILIQLGTNFINDLYDFISGADDENRLGPQRAVQSGLLTEKSNAKGGIPFCFILCIIDRYLFSIYRWFSHPSNW